MTSYRPVLDRDETKAMRGLAIFGIIMHNYCHFLYKLGVVKENEYTFNAELPQRLLEHLTTGSGHPVVDLFSFFGCYGVPVFLFVSGFGLTLKYEAAGMPRAGAGRFVIYHFLKLFRLMVMGYLLFMILSLGDPRGYHGYTWDKVAAQLLMFINLLPEPNKIIKPGPYWFFGLMLQFYIVYRLLIYRRHWGFTAALILLCWGIQEMCGPMSDELNRVRYNCIGGMLPFGAGVLFARYGGRWCRSAGTAAWCLCFVIMSALVCASVFNYHTWMWTPLFIVGATIALVKILPRPLLSPCEWTGALSAALFVVHPIVREMTVWQYRSAYWERGIIIYLLASVALAILFRWILSFIPSPKLRLRNEQDTENPASHS